MSLGNQIKEDHLTCSICLNGFRKPKALPCLHTFCELCLQDYAVSRGYESSKSLPCPMCRVSTPMPLDGIQGFPDNHLVESLSDTVDKLDPPRPVPRPRRSLEQGGASGFQSGSAHTGMGQNYDRLRAQEDASASAPPGINTDINTSPGPDDFELVDDQNNLTPQHPFGGTSPSPVDSSPPPPYSSVADTRPGDDNARQKLCANDTDQGWMVVPNQSVPQTGPSYPGASPGTFMGYPQHPYNSQPPQGVPYYPNAPVGWTPNSHGPPHPGNYPPSSQPTDSNPNAGVPTENENLHQDQGLMNSTHHNSSSPIYPSVPSGINQDTACSDKLMLRFGKQGSTARDFIKPIGLAVSKEGHYIVSDNGGGQNRLMVFNSGGEITTAFKSGCKVKDISVTRNNEVIAAIYKANNGIRRFTLNGQLKGEYGKFFTFEEPSGIAELMNNGIVLTGASNHCVYVLTEQMKLQTKFGRKGNGDGYFMHPGFVSVNSKNHIIVSDEVNNCIQVFSAEGKFKQRFGSTGKSHEQFQKPMGVCVDSKDNIIIADAGNFRVEAYSPRGKYLCSIVRDTWQIGENVMPINVAVTPTGKIAVLLRGPYFAEVRIYATKHQEIPQDVPNPGLPVSFGSAVPIAKNLGIWPSS